MERARRVTLEVNEKLGDLTTNSSSNQLYVDLVGDRGVCMALACQPSAYLCICCLCLFRYNSVTAEITNTSLLLRLPFLVQQSDDTLETCLQYKCDMMKAESMISSELIKSFKNSRDAYVSRYLMLFKQKVFAKRNFLLVRIIFAQSNKALDEKSDG